ncbi:MAG TPA: spermine synthase, partial [Roseiflexaceae bacterium]|nr:spermine synthase [Roseiflexaceae bacterium]
MRFSRLFGYVLGLFFLTGLSGLVYEVAWFRLLSLTLGVSVYAASAVLTAFMGGLALGSWAFGRIADDRLQIVDGQTQRGGHTSAAEAIRTPHRASPLALFALLQLGVGVYALLTPALFAQLTGAYVWAYRQFQPGEGAFMALRVALATLALLPPTFLMGGTLPALSRLLAGHAHGRGRELGALYAVNTVGGVVGALAAGVFLIALIGTSATLFLAGVIDLAVAAAALALSRWGVIEERGARSEERGARTDSQRPRKRGGTGKRADQLEAGAGPSSSVGRPGRRSGGRALVVPGGRGAAALAVVPEAERVEPRPLLRLAPAQVALGGFALSGFASLGYQVVWTRLLAIFSLNAVYSFTIMLATFLAGLALGSALAAPRADRAARPLALFGWLQVAVGLCGVLVLYVFARMPTLLELFTGPDTFAASLWAEFFAAAVTMLVPTLLLGAMFPLAARIYIADGEPQTDDRRPTTDEGTQRADGSRGSPVPGPRSTVAERVGRLYALNTLGAMLGAAAAGFALIPLLGLQRAALALALINLAVGA